MIQFDPCLIEHKDDYVSADGLWTPQSLINVVITYQRFHLSMVLVPLLYYSSHFTFKCFDKNNI